jgi:DNA polymerase III delta subunit
LSPEELAKRLKLHSYAAQKGMAQAQNFDLGQLEECHRHLVETDWQIKTGEIEPVLALDMLVVALTRV